MMRLTKADHHAVLRARAEETLQRAMMALAAATPALVDAFNQRVAESPTLAIGHLDRALTHMATSFEQAYEAMASLKQIVADLEDGTIG